MQKVLQDICCGVYKKKRMQPERIASFFPYFLYGNLCFCVFNRDNRHRTFVCLTYFELYSSVYQSEKSVVLAHTDVFTRVEFSTSLTNDDVTCFASFATKYLNA